MTNRTNTRRCGRHFSILTAKTLILSGFAVIIALSVSSLALHTRTAATQGLDKNRPNMNGDAAVDGLKKHAANGLLGDAIATTNGDDDLVQSPTVLTQLTAVDGTTNDVFGTSIAISGDTAVIGAMGNNNNLGSAYVFVRSGTVWTQQQKLIPNDGVSGDRFGQRVAISGDTIVVGSPNTDTAGGSSSGAVYVFVRSGTTWTEQQKLAASDGNGLDDFSDALGISGDMIIVGSPGKNYPGRDDQGAAYVFFRNGTSWSEQQILTAGDGSGFDQFGYSVAMSGNTAIIGARSDTTTPIFNHGSAYVFTRSGTTWSQQQKLTPADPEQSNRFGASVAISNDTVIVGADFDGIGTQPNQGSAYVFVRTGTVWNQQQKLIAADGDRDDRFGISVAISGEIAIVGVPGDEFGTILGRGSAYAFRRCGTLWTQSQKLFLSNGAAGDGFGTSLAFSGDSALVGVPGRDISGIVNQGAAYSVPPADLLPTNSPVGAACSIGIEVNVNTDEDDVDPPDGICDVDLSTAGPQCTLRAAIQTANAKVGFDVITFDIPGGGVRTISPATALPDITSKVTIDGSTQPGYVDRPMIEIQGASAGNSVSGLVFASLSNGSALRAVTVNRFDSSGIEFQSNNNVLDRCFVGLGADGITTYPLPGGQAIGIRITGAGNRIGGDRTQSTGSNYITGNTSSQIEIDSAAATGNRIVGNDIGSLVDDTVVPGGVDVRGIRIIGGATATLIGGTTFEEKNSISANYAGIEVNEQAGDTVITHNDIEFCGIGVLILNSSGNRVGGQTSGTDQLEGNIFDRNELGVLVDAGSDARPRDIYPSLADNTSGATLRGRSFAVQTSGSNHIYGNIFMVLEKTQLPEGTTTGVVVGDAEDTSIGLEGSGGYRNFIADQTEAGIVVRKEAVRTSIAANIIGLQADDTPRPNRLGIRLAGNGTEVRNNLISGNIDFGVVIDRLAAGDAFPMDNVVRSNFIGTNSAGTAAVANSGPGVSIEGNQNEISYNLVSGNAGVGISVLGNTNTVFGNKIGTNHLLGDTAIGNTEGGIAIFGSSNFIRSNLISGNLGGIALQRHPDRPDLSPTGNIIDDNNIGVNAALTAAVPNASGGIALLNATNNQLTRNIVAGNGTVGIGIAQGSTGNTLTLNYIGVAPGGVVIPNDGPGIYIKESAGNFIGNASGGNTVAANRGDGIKVERSASTEIYANLIGVIRMPNGDFVARGNEGNGINLIDSDGTMIGDLDDAKANLVAANIKQGILIDQLTELLKMRNNLVGTLIRTIGNRKQMTVPEGQDFGNGQGGVRISNGSGRNIIGGVEPHSGNFIANNGGPGVWIDETAGNGNLVDPNSIYGNAGPGIALGNIGHTPNDPTDADVGPNKLQNYPTMTLSIVGGDLIVSYQVDSAPAHSTYGGPGIYVEFFEADATGAGRDFLGSDHYLLSDYNNGLPGTRVKNLGNAVALGIVAGDKLTATATDAEGNSSEFTPAVNAPGGAPGFEGDVAPRPNGDGNMLSTDITQMRRFVSGLDTPNPATNEAQRIDCAPRSTFGDGIINSSDVVQGRRYVSGLDVLTPAGGPASRGGSVPESILIPNFENSLDAFQRELRIGEPQLRGSTAVVPIELTPEGNEVAMSFTLEYDPNLLTNPRITLGEFVPVGSTLTVNTTEPGRIGFLIDSSNAMIASSLPLSIVSVSFDAKEEASGEAPIYLTGSLAAKGISDAFGNSLSMTYVGGVVRFEAKMY